ncbi:hypothetical protein EZV62_002407 [Acer yangbiense]|uniref:RlpA-like protein double-psi beta-barrel domain-containing protein n=1 Tax=Acer yangbiense TaxID=1000413 RepID=A0A5C7IXH5_9ROSI|nr:hypothetical protein EZV62_002407 [Acer yangbiense]
MANKLFLASLSLVFTIFITFPFLSNAISSCNGACRTVNDCSGQLICIKGKCNDDRDVKTQICSGGDGGGGGGDGVDSSESSNINCQPSGKFTCQGKSFPKFSCSPPVTSATKAKLTNNDFSAGGDGGGESKCDGKFHGNSKPVVALSTGWYNGGSRCGKLIKIRASNGKSVMAAVVDECDSMNGCDEEHAGQPPCKNNIVDGSDAVWTALGLDKDLGVVDVTWSP